MAIAPSWEWGIEVATPYPLPHVRTTDDLKELASVTDWLKWSVIAGRGQFSVYYFTYIVTNRRDGDRHFVQEYIWLVSNNLVGFRASRALDMVAAYFS